MTNVYQSIYDLINNVLFGSTLVAGTFQELAVVQLSTAISLAFIVLPLFLIWGIVKAVF